MSNIDDNLSDDLTEDAFLGGRLTVLQSKSGFRAGIDTVLLGASAMVKPGDAVLDAGCGAGIAGLCLASRVLGTTVTGMDVNSRAIDLAQQNANRNGMGSRFEFQTADVFKAADTVGADQFDHVISNPPFHDPSKERLSPDEGKALAHAFAHEEAYRETMARWIKGCLRPLKTKGSITLINRAEGLPPMLAALDGPTGDIEVIPLRPHLGEPARRVIVRAKKGSKTPMTLHPGLILHRPEAEGGGFTPQIDAVLREGASLDVSAP